MRSRRVQPPPASGKINVTPLIDVVMCMIVFYLIVGRLASDQHARVDLPSSGVGTGEERATGPVVTIASVGQGSRVLLDGREVSLDDLKASLAGAVGGPTVQVRADKSLPYSEVSPIIDACRAAGLTSVKLTARREGGGR